MSSFVFDIENLQKLNYERSKNWASFFDSIMEIKDLGEVNINDFEHFFGTKPDENDSNDGLSFMEDSDCVETSDTRELVKENMILSSEGNDKHNEFLDILDQTMPIITEHNRQLKEAGLDRVLSTFNKQKIEEKVGSWLYRHNSLYVGTSPLPYNASKKDYVNKSLTKREIFPSGRKNLHYSKFVESDSDDSLQSGATARYIRSSRAVTIKNFSPATTMIKSYRRVKNTRDAVGQKYAYKTAEEKCHLKTICQRPRFCNEIKKYNNHYELRRPQIQHKQKTPILSSFAHKERRRKVFRKRMCSNSCSNNNTSSDSDFYFDQAHRFNSKCLSSSSQYHRSEEYDSNLTKKCSNLKMRSQRNPIKIPISRMDRIFYYYNSRTKSLSTSLSSSFGYANSLRTAKKNSNIYHDNGQWERESGCLYKDRTLCEKYNDVSATSSDEWHPKNVQSQTKFIKKQSLQSHIQNSITRATENLSVPNVLLIKNPKTITKKDEALKNNTNKKHIQEEKCNNKSQNSIESKSYTEIAYPLSDSDEGFEQELQMAIEASKKTYEREQKSKDTNNIKKQNSSEKKLLLNTFLANIQSEAIYNSTAMYSKGLACKRQITGKLAEEKQENISITKSKKQKNLEENLSSLINKSASSPILKKIVTAKKTIPSTVICSSEKKFEFASKNVQGSKLFSHVERSQNEISNCSLVTSTTKIELAVTPETPQDLHRKVSTFSSSNEPTQKGILIYDPENRSMVPPQSFTDNGYFIITKEHLSNVIGEKRAAKFLKYYIGRKCFKTTSSVYFRPAIIGYLDTGESSASDSCDDLDNIGQYGDLYESHKEMTTND